MNCYEILGIAANSDIKNIKKSYAKLVKIYNPEDDPEAYQKIRKAYDTAIVIAKRKNKKQKINSIEADLRSNGEVFRNMDGANTYDGTEQTGEIENGQLENNIINDNLQNEIHTFEELKSNYVANNLKTYSVNDQLKVHIIISQLECIYEDIIVKAGIRCLVRLRI